jgi:hypothetical protein
VFDDDNIVPAPSLPVALVACAIGGYWIVTAEGGTYAFGEAPFLGSLGGIPISAPIVFGSSTPSGEGLYLLGRDGAVYAWGDAKYAGRLLWNEGA